MTNERWNIFSKQKKTENISNFQDSQHKVGNPEHKVGNRVTNSSFTNNQCNSRVKTRTN